jgi:hypothetical protein
MKHQSLSTLNSVQPGTKGDDKASSNQSAKVTVNKIPKKTMKKYKDTEEELEKIRRETDSQDTRLLKIQNVARQVEDDYLNKKKEVENKLMDLSRRKQVFTDKQKKAKEDLNKEEERVKKIEDKKIQEKKRLDENDQKIILLKKEREEKEKFKEEKLLQRQILEDEVSELKKYEDFLKEVMKMSPEFFDEAEGQDGFNVQNLIAKHDRIKNNKKNFEEAMDQIDQMKETEVEEFQKYKKEQEEIILIDTSKIYILQEQFEEANKELTKMQAEINRIELKTNLETSKWSQIIMSIGNLYTRAREGKETREMEKRKEKERDQPHSVEDSDKPEKVEKKKKDLRKWEEIRTKDQLDDLQFVEEQVMFLRDLRSRYEAEKKTHVSKSQKK